MENRHRFTVYLNPDEMVALKILAIQERRDFRDQAAMMIRQGLEQYGMIPWKPIIHILGNEIPSEQNEDQLLSQG